MKTEPSEEEEEEGKKKKNPNEEDRTSEKEEGKKKKFSWSKVAAEWVPHVCLITKMSLSYEL